MKVEVASEIYWVGAIDWNVRSFHGFTYSTHRGTTYNAYLILDEKVALVDTVLAPFAGSMMNRIREIISPEKIDYIIANHLEMDHTGAIAEILKYAPKAKIVCTAKCREGLLKHYSGDWNFFTVKTGDTVNLGQRDLKFIEAPMLHWPDSMFTYVEAEALLLPNDAFGQHLATSERFDDEVSGEMLMGEAAKYYANILWPMSLLVEKKIEEIRQMGLELKTIAPSHGIIWRSAPMKIVDAYLKWARGESADRAMIVYDTMWGSTKMMAKAMLEGISSEGVAATLYRLPISDLGDIVKELLETRGILVGSSTINAGMIHTVASFLEELRGLKPRGKIGAAFGSYGWGGGATAAIEEKLKQSKIEVALPALKVKWVPDDDELKRCREFGREFARKIKSASAS
ncbi:MAG: flavodoxin domain-containing protein [Candidatus Bathyarchaeia archaeon]